MADNHSSESEQQKANGAHASRPRERSMYGQPYGYAYGEGPGGLYEGSPVYADESGEAGFLGQISVRRLIRVFRRKWKLLAGTVLFALAAGYYLILTTTPIYETYSEIEIFLRRPRIMAQRDAIIEEGGYDYSGKAFNTQVQKLNATRVRDEALAIFRDAAPDNELTDAELLKDFHVQIKPTGNSRIVHIIVQHSDPVLASELATAYGHAAVKTALISNREASDNAVAWLQAQATSQRQVLEKTDKLLLGFRESNNVEALQSQKKTVEQALLAFNESLVGVEQEVELMKDLVKELSRVEMTPEAAGQLPTSTPRSGEITALFEQFRQAMDENHALLARYTENHPKVVEQAQVLNHLRGRLVDAIQRAKATAETNLALLTEQAQSLRKKKTERERMAGDIELHIVRSTMELNALEREIEAADISYRGILTRIEEARLSADENTATIKYLEEARVPSTPIRPRRGRIRSTSLLLGLLAGLVFALVSDRLDDHIWNVADVERGLGLKVLGLIPHVEDTSRADLALACIKNRFSRLAEAIAGIRGFLGTGPFRERCKVFLVVSAAPEEGKTILSSNLACSFALSGKSTLLVDMDLRRPRLRKIFDLAEGTEGLMKVLARKDMDALTRLPQKTEVENLDVVVSYPEHTLSPSELLGSPLVGEFIAWARESYDCVIIDSPPLGAVSDSVVLGTLTDGVILMCRPMKTRKRPTLTAVRHLADAGANLLGVVMNDVHFDARGYGSYHGAEYHQYPHYAYYSHRSETEEEQAAAPALRS